ncbi:uncharacterized protein [Misgurnus anguillicaudatus]|uniref:uncharacterized protein n=1 Tax=Misgurnus anguillicaudatus TaxID=75329 RepID=UPI003CCF21D6
MAHCGDLTVEHEGDKLIDLSDPLQEEGFGVDAAEVLPLYENCLGCSDCEPGCSTSRQNGCGRSSWAGDRSACADDEADWSKSQMNACDQASWADDNGLPSSGQQTPNTTHPSVDENNDESSKKILKENPQLVHEFRNRILAQYEEIKKYLDNCERELHRRFDTFDRKLQELNDRLCQIYVLLDAHDGAVQTSLDRQRSAIEEIAHLLRCLLVGGKPTSRCI